MTTMESWSPRSVQRLLVLLLCLLVCSNVLLAYSLKNCTFNFRRDAAPEVCLDCTNRKLVTVPDDIPKDTVTLKLSDNQIENISRGDFGDLPKLRILSLTSNLITHIDDGSFTFLAALKKLHMVENQLSRLTSNVFEGLSNLTLLDLRDNDINFIHPSAFRFLTSLKTVILDNNKLGMVSDIQTLLQLPHLQKIRMKDNLLSTFQSKDLLLNKSSSLKVLDVEGNDLRRFSITTSIFPHLQTINMCRCGQSSILKWDIPDQSLLRNITRLELSHAAAFENIPSVLRSLDSLRQLGLSFMEEWINKGLLRTVCRIKTLQSLDLSFNNVPGLSARLGDCSQLQELSLRYTQASDLPKGSVGKLRRLRYLDLGLNFFSKVPDDIKGLSSLRVLKLAFNRISNLTCDDFKYTSRLTRLILNNNRITELDRCIFENLHHLKVLEIGWNLLWTVGGAFKTGLRNLEVLNLKQNYLVRFEKGDLEGLGSLKQLGIVSNKIAEADLGAFDGLHNLTSLNVSLPSYFKANFHALQQMEDLMISFPGFESSFRSQQNKTVFNLKSLKRLEMFCPDDHTGQGIHVHIEMLQSAELLEDFTAENIFLSAPSPDIFQFNSQLKSLTITESDMSDLSPELFKTTPNLQVLDLSRTNLKSLDFLSQASLSALRYLHLRENALTVINDSLIKSLPALIYLDLSNNPLACDCSNAGFIQWVKSNSQTQVDGAHQYDCHFPQIKWGTKLLDFDVQSCWADIDFLCYISSTSLVMLTLLTSFVYHFLRWQIVYAFHLFQAYLYDSKKKKKGAPHLYDAFISYNVNDEDWVYREMLQTLEGEQGWKLCLHHRDFQPGKPIIENITDAIYSSRKTICVISQSYLQSEWCSREIQMASFRLFDEKKDVLILLFLEEIPAHLMSPYYRMRKLVKKRTYLSWPQAGQHKGIFWQNVRRALETGDFNMDNENVLVGPEG